VRTGNQLERPGARSDPHPRHPAAWNRGRSQRRRAAAGKAERREPAHAQLVGNRVRIGADRCQPERRRSGPAVTRPVEGDQPDPVPGRELLPETQVQPGRGSPVEVHHHRAIAITRVTDPQHPLTASDLHVLHLTMVTPPSPNSNQTATRPRPTTAANFWRSGDVLTCLRDRMCSTGCSSLAFAERHPP